MGCWDWFYIGNRLQETQPNQKSPQTPYCCALTRLHSMRCVTLSTSKITHSLGGSPEAICSETRGEMVAIDRTRRELRCVCFALSSSVWRTPRLEACPQGCVCYLACCAPACRRKARKRKCLLKRELPTFDENRRASREGEPSAR